MIEKLKAEVTALKTQLMENGITPRIGVPKKMAVGATLLPIEEEKVSTSLAST